MALRHPLQSARWQGGDVLLLSGTSRHADGVDRGESLSAEDVPRDAERRLLPHGPDDGLPGWSCGVSGARAARAAEAHAFWQARGDAVVVQARIRSAAAALRTRR